MVFWFKILLSPVFENRIICRTAEDVISLSRDLWLNNLMDILVQFGWFDMLSGRNLQGISWYEVNIIIIMLN